MATKSIIIAAGKGSRLKPLTDNVPKCLLRIAGKTILERQLEVFRKLGLNEIAVIRGYKKEKINFSGLTYFENDDYENNNILHSLFCARNFMNKGFISTYSDIVYEASVVRKLLKHPGDICIIIDTCWKDTYIGRTKHPVAEAELVMVDEKNRVVKIGKDAVTPEDAHGEFIGLSKFSDKGSQVLIKEFERLEKKYRKVKEKSFHRAKEFKKAYLTDMIQELVDRGHNIYSVDIKGGWREIDTAEDLERANTYWSKKEKLK